MVNNKNTKKALLVSLLSLLLCCTMLIGTTFAWFTDSVTSGRNKIVAGNLDVVLEYKTPDSTDWAEVTSDTVLFGEDSLWEPGHTEVVALRIRNAGTLALKYDLATTVYEEVAGTNVYDDSFLLSDYLNIGYSVIQQDNDIGDIFMGMMLGSRDNAVALANSEFGKSVENPYPVIMPGEAHVCALAISMPTTVGNEANYKTGTDAPYISFGVTLLATQATVESDSFDNQYDKDADFITSVSNEEELIAALAAGGNCELENDISVSSMIEIPEGKISAIEGNGYTLTRADSYTGTILSLGEYAELTLSNITLDGENVESSGNLIYIDSFGKLTLNDGAVLENHVGGTTYDSARGPENSVIHCDGATTIVMNDGSVIQNNIGKGNFATVIASMYDLTCELNGGKIINNTSEKNNYTVNFGNYANITVSDGFEAYGNTDGGLMRVNQQSTFTMNGGKLDGNGKAAIYTWVAKYVTMNGGEIIGNVYLNYAPATVGGTDVDGRIQKDKEVTKWALNLTPDFGTVKYYIEGNDITQLSIVPAEGYTYVEGDEAKLICENAGYETYWDTESGCFKVQASE